MNDLGAERKLQTMDGERENNLPHGLIIVHTGDGKGKTTAALGLALRAWGNGLRVLVLQFIKGGQSYGELKAINEVAPTFWQGRLVIEQCGKGFTQRGTGDDAEHKTAASDAVRKARQATTSGKWDMVILDEINYAVKFGLVEKKDLLELIDVRPKTLHLVFTGRDALPELIERADLVTEMRMVKHPFSQGVAAQCGIEF